MQLVGSPSQLVYYPQSWCDIHHSWWVTHHSWCVLPISAGGLPSTVGVITITAGVLPITGAPCTGKHGRQPAAAGSSPAAEPGSRHCMGVLAAVPQPPEGLQSHRQQDQEQRDGRGLQRLEGQVCPAGQSQAAVQEGPWRSCAPLLRCLGVSLACHRWLHSLCWTSCWQAAVTGHSCQQLASTLSVM